MLRQRSKLQTSSLSLSQKGALNILDINWEWSPPQRTKHENIKRHFLAFDVKRESIMTGGVSIAICWQSREKGSELITRSTDIWVTFAIDAKGGEKHERERSLMKGGAWSCQNTSCCMGVSINDKGGDCWVIVIDANKGLAMAIEFSLMPPRSLHGQAILYVHDRWTDAWLWEHVWNPWWLPCQIHGDDLCKL